MVNKVRWVRGLLLLIVCSVLTSCIQPDAAPTATFAPELVNPVAAPTLTPVGGLSSEISPGDTSLVLQLILQRGDTPSGLVVWYDMPLGPDRLQGFAYTNQNNTLCTGFLLMAYPNGVRQSQNDNGAKGCEVQSGLGGLAGASMLVTSDGQPHTLVVGRVLDATVNAVAAEFSDGTSLPATPVSGNFMIVKSGLAQIVNVTAIDALGNFVMISVPQVPVG